MDFRQLLLSQHGRTHSSAVRATDLPLEDMLLSGLSDEQVRQRPRKDLNSIAWLLWHMARTEDATVNLIIAGRSQVLDAADWPKCLNVARRDIGTGMTSEEVSDLSAAVDIAGLRAYRAAVGRQTQEVIENLRLDELQKPVDSSLIDKAVRAGAFGPNALGLGQFWMGKPKEFFLSFSTIGHSYTQMGEAWVLRGLLGLVGP